MRIQWLGAAAALFCAGAVSAAPYHAPRMPWGAPDLEGMWSNSSLTTLQRRPGLPATIKEAEVPALERRIVTMIEMPDGDELGQGASEWSDAAHLARLGGEVRTSWIVEPSDGRIHYTPEGQRRFAKMLRGMLAAFDNPEDRPTSERCLIASGGTAGPPLINHKYGSNLQIVQTGDAVAIYSEMNHDVRIIRLNASHLPQQMRPWMGDSVGHFEGETLVVETTHFNPAEADHGGYYMSPEATLVERFTRTLPTEIRYEFTVADPAIYEKPWRGEMAFHSGPATILEYACHEGNYAVRGALAGARREESLKTAKPGQ